MINNIKDSLFDVKLFAKLHLQDKLYYDYYHYVIHLDNLIQKLSENGHNDKTILTAAYLYPIINNTWCTFEEITKEFGEDVSNLLYDCCYELGRTEEERFMKTARKWESNKHAYLIVLYDLYCDWSSTITMNDISRMKNIATSDNVKLKITSSDKDIEHIRSKIFALYNIFATVNTMETFNF